MLDSWYVKDTFSFASSNSLFFKYILCVIKHRTIANKWYIAEIIKYFCNLLDLINFYIFYLHFAIAYFAILSKKFLTFASKENKVVFCKNF